MSTSRAPDELQLRVSVATFNRVLFPHPRNGTTMLALERKAGLLNGADVSVRAQPFGGAVRILNPAPLEKLIGRIQYDSERSRAEQDFRILIRPSQWDAVREYCLRHLEKIDDPEIEAQPHRELAEEFAETMDIRLKPEQYAIQPLGFVVENKPVPTANTNARGRRTVRLYRIFDVQVIDVALCGTMLAAGKRYSDDELGRLAIADAQNGGKGRANSILTLPLSVLTEAYLALAPELRFRRLGVQNHELDESVLAILEGVDVPQYQRL